MMLKRALCAVMAIVMLFALTSCKKSGGGKLSDLEVKLNGVTVSASSTLEMLGSDFGVTLEPFYDGKAGFILYKGQHTAFIAFDENAAEYDIRKKNIKELAGKGVSVNGIVPGSSKSDVINAIGSPTEKGSVKEQGIETWYYREAGWSDEKNYLYITFYKNDVQYLLVDFAKP